MVRARRWLLGLAAGCGLGAAAFDAEAQAEAIRVSYRAMAGCPEQSVFVAELAARTSRVRPAEPDEQARSVDVAISRQGDVVHGLLIVSGSGEAATRREVTGNDCAEVVSALALVAALVIDPRASNGAEPPLATSPTAGVPSPAAPSEHEPQPVAPSAAPRASPQAPATVPRDQPLEPRAEPSAGAHDHLFVGAAGHGLFGPAPDPALGGGAFIGIEDERPDVFAAGARASLLAVTSSATFEGGVEARFTWILARLEGCPVRPLVADPLRLELCSLMDFGVLDTQGKGLDQAERSARFWLAPGALGRASWELGRGLVAEFAGGFAVPLRRYPFEYDPAGNGSTVQVHAVPFAAGALSAGARYRFP
jgi:hypothetical protein